MAEDFKNAGLEMTQTPTLVYTCPVGSKAIVLGLIISNIDGVADADATVYWVDTSASRTYYLAFTTPVSADGVMSLIGGAVGKIVLEESDTLYASASANGDLSLTLAVVEIS